MKKWFKSDTFQIKALESRLQPENARLKARLRPCLKSMGFERKGVLPLTLLTVAPLLLLVVAFTWGSTGANPLNLLIPRQQWWGGKSNVSNTSADSGLVDLAVGGTDVHVVWRENTGASADIYFKNKAKDGNWSGAADLTQTTAGKCLNPAIAVVDNGASDHIHVVWEDYAVNYRDIFYRKSLDGAITWDNPLSGSPDSITADTYHAYAPDIAITSTIPHVVWHGAPPGYTKYKVFYSKDPDGDGLNWTDSYTVSTSANDNQFPAIAIDGSNRIHVTWYVLSPDLGVIQYRRSTDGGSTWSSVADLTTGDDSTYPDIAAKDNDVYVVWNTNTDPVLNRYQVRCRRSSDGGNSWSTATTITTATTSLISPYPSPRVSVDISDTVHVVWHGLGTTVNQEIWYSQSTDHGDHWSSPVNISQNPDEPSQLASIGTDSEGDTHVAWQEQDLVSNQWDIFYKRTSVASGGGIYLPMIMKNSS